MIQAAYCIEPMKRTLEGFGPRLAALRKARGLTQEELGERVGMSQRMMAYYEQEDAQPPGALLVDLATALEVSTDELLGLADAPEPVPSSTYRLRKRLRKLEELPASDQKTVLKIVDALVEKRTIEAGG